VPLRLEEVPRHDARAQALNTRPRDMDEQPLHWDAEALWQQLEPQLPGLSVEVVARISSTNTALLERARIVTPPAEDSSGVQVRRSVESGAFGRRSADLQPCLLVAEHQTAGRGRQGRVWQAAPGSSLTFSLALPLAPRDWSGLSLAVGVALADALEPALDSAPAAGRQVAQRPLADGRAGEQRAAASSAASSSRPWPPVRAASPSSVSA
jgi:hypothetical protein